MAIALGRARCFPFLRWLACFSAVPPRTINASPATDRLLHSSPSSTGVDQDVSHSHSEEVIAQQQLLPFPSFHCFDDSEVHADLCREAATKYFQQAPQIVHHDAGHSIPKNKKEAVEVFWRFVEQIGDDEKS